MITVALDLSVASTGICISDDIEHTCKFVRLTDKAYERSFVRCDKWAKSMHNSIRIADAIVKLVMPYRFQPIRIVIESVGFGLLRGHTNSVTALLFEGAIVASTLHRLFACDIAFIEPTKHKKAFTGNGKASKQQSVERLLQLFPQLVLTTDKLDDMADAASLTSVFIADLHNYVPKVICI